MAEEQSKKPVTLTRDELYRQVWETPMQRLATQYGISGNGLAKICDRLQVPYPPRGYWAKREAGKPTRQIKLPEPGKDIAQQVTIAPTPPRQEPVQPVMSPEVQQNFDAALAKSSAVTVPETLRRAHPVVAEWIAERAREIAAAKRDRFSAAYAPKPFTELEHRRHRILDTLFKELEKRGFEIKTERYRGAWLGIGGERVDFLLHEHIRQERRPLTPEQKRNLLYSNQQWTQVKVPTGNLMFVIKTHLGSGIPDRWSDAPDMPLEKHIGEMIATFSLAGPLLQEKRRLLREQERLRLEAERRRQDEIDRRRRDKNRWRRFVELANRWEEAETARRFLAALEAMPSASDASFGELTHDAWLAWARERLKNYDPLSHGADGIWNNLAEVTAWEYSS